MQCINCKSEVTGKFCANCGQRTTVKRITFKEGWLDFWSRVYGFDGMFPRTMRDLTIRPGVAAREYIEGNRVKHYGPVGYFFLMITVYLLALSLMDLNILDFMRGAQSTFQTENTNMKVAELAQQKVSENIKLFVFLIIPFQAFTAKYLFFRNGPYNFLENTVLPFYTAGHLYWISILMAIGYKLTGSAAFGPGGGGLFVFVVLIISVVYFAFSYTTFISHQSRIKSFFKGIGIYFVSYFIFMLFMMIAIVIGIVLLAYLDPDTFDLIRPANNR